MISGALALLAATAIGVPIVLGIHPTLPVRTSLATGLFAGLGSITLTLLLLSTLGVRWSTLVLFLSVLPISCLMFLKWVRTPQEKTRDRSSIFALILEGIAYLTIVGYARFAIRQLYMADYWAMWGLRGRAFFELGAVDWQFLESPDNWFSHPNYPPFYTLTLTYLALVAGKWVEAATPPLFVALPLAVLFLVRDRAVRDFGSPVAAAAVMALLANLALTKWIGLADALILTLATASALLLREALQTSDARLFTIGAIILGLTGMTKNEGIAFVVAATVGVLVHDWRSARRLWPAFALTAVWPLMKLTHDLGADLSQPGTLERAVDRIIHPGVWIPILPWLVPYEEMVWLGALIGLVLGGWAFVRRERFVLVTLMVQLAVSLSVYLVTPYPLKWHVATSWQRITAQFTLLVAYIGLLAAVETVRRKVDESFAQSSTAA